jgi:hypothetical protein
MIDTEIDMVILLQTARAIIAKRAEQGAEYFINEKFLSTLYK